MADKFKLKTTHKPAGDQLKAIPALVDGVKKGLRHQTLLGVTGSGKTFTGANVIAQIQKPTLVIAHNKTLAAQLAQEYRDFFPDNAVHYFVSYYDYYQPEAYVAATDTYIEKDAAINEEIERLRHASTQALLTRRDVIIVASVSCIYGLGSPTEYLKEHLLVKTGQVFSRNDFLQQLVERFYERTNADLNPGTFRVVGNAIEVMPPSEKVIYRLVIEGGKIEAIEQIDALTRKITNEPDSFFLFPAKHFITNEDERNRAINSIKLELDDQLKKLNKEGKILEAERLKRRTNYDLAMIREIGYTSGIENYSRHLSGKKPGEAPETLLAYFPKDKNGKPDFLTIIDESHVTLSQIAGMQAGDKSRKQNLVDFGFRLPSALDNRPLTFAEFNERVGQLIYTSATPANYELEKSKEEGQVVEQIIRPTGLLDPVIEVKPIVSSLNRSQGTVGLTLDSKSNVLAKTHPAKTSDYESDVRPTQLKAGYGGQIQDFIIEAKKEIKRGFRAIATTLTKKMAEDLTEYLKGEGIKAEYLHSDVKTLERIQILTNFRKGEFDCLVGVNLLREGLDLPEVSLIGILDADKEGFLRSETSLIQTIGRAARNAEGRVILYADHLTGSLERAMNETRRRRALQEAYNKEHKITPKTIQKKIKDITEDIMKERERAVKNILAIDQKIYEGNPKALKGLIKDKKAEMEEAVKELDFESAAILRDEIKELETKLPQK